MQGGAAAVFAEQDGRGDRLRPAPNGRGGAGCSSRTADAPSDGQGHHRLLAYLAPTYTAEERKTLTRAQRATFNLDMVVAGWAATFVIYPSIPGELDLPMLLDAAATARTGPRDLGRPADPARLRVPLPPTAARGDREDRRRRGRRRRALQLAERYCADMRDRVLHGPEDYSDIEPEYRLWFWAADVGEASPGSTHPGPARALVAGEGLPASATASGAGSARPGPAVEG